MDSRTSGYILQIRASNIGKSEDLVQADVTPLERSVQVLVNGIPCDNPARTEVVSPIVPSYTVISCSLQERPVGFVNMTVVAAGQQGNVVPADPAFGALQVCGVTFVCRVSGRFEAGVPGFSSFRSVQGAGAQGVV